MTVPTTAADDLAAFVEAHLAAAQGLRRDLVEVEGPRTFEGTALPYHELTLHVANASCRASLLAAVHPDEAVRTVADECERRSADLSTDVYQDTELYRALRAIDLDGLPPDARRFLELELSTFERGGVGLEPADRARFRELEDRLMRAGQDFAHNLTADASVVRLAPGQLDGLPESFRAAHPPGPDGTVSVPARWSESLPVMRWARDDDARRLVFEAVSNLGWPANAAVLDDLVTARAEQARLLGFDDFADYQTATAMTGSGSGVQAFIDWLSLATEEGAAEECRVLLERLRRDVPSAEHVSEWQRDYYLGLVAAERPSPGTDASPPGTGPDRPLETMFALSGSLFGLEYRPAPHVPRWHESVTVYDVVEGQEKLGRLFVDLQSRPGKQPGGALHTLVPGVAGRQLPELALVYSAPPGTPGAGTLRQVAHEFGHFLQKLFSARQRFNRLARGADEIDFMEVPSLVFEELTRDPGSPPKSFGRALRVRADLVLQALALWCHQLRSGGLDTTELLVEAFRRYGPFPYVEGTHLQASFRHLPSYGSCYYTYLWSQVLALDLVGEWRRRGGLDPVQAGRFRDALLVPGASVPATDQVRLFLGREPDDEAFRRWLGQ